MAANNLSAPAAPKLGAISGEVRSSTRENLDADAGQRISVPEIHQDPGVTGAEFILANDRIIIHDRRTALERPSMNTTSPVTLVRPPSVKEVIKRRRPLRNVNKEAGKKITPLNRMALWITIHVGSMGFFLIIFGWTAIWLGWNLLAPAASQFDPPMTFVFWLFISNVIQILLMPLIMVGQNVQGSHAELRAEYDLEVNVKAEREIEVILRHLEYQNSMLLAMLEKLGVSVAEALHPSNA